MSEIVLVRSANNNVFRYCSYFMHWSRILFHDSHGFGMQVMRNKYKIPNHIKTVEIDLTPANGFTGSWQSQKTNEGNIRHHCSAFGLGDKFTMNLPDEVHQSMLKHYDIEEIEKLLHYDVLSLIDFSK